MTNLPLTVPDLLSLTGMTGLLYMLTAVVHSAQLLPSRRFLPLLSMALGAVVGVFAASSTGANVADAALLGVVSGVLASGAEEARKGAAEGTSIIRDRLDQKRLEAEIERWSQYGDEIEELAGEPPSD